MRLPHAFIVNQANNLPQFSDNHQAEFYQGWLSQLDQFIALVNDISVKPQEAQSWKECVGMIDFENKPFDCINKDCAIDLIDIDSEIKKIPILTLNSNVDSSAIDTFLTTVFTLQKFNQQFNESITRGKLIKFHSECKYLLMAKSQTDYKKLGKMIASVQSLMPEQLPQFAQQYRDDLVATLVKPATCSNHTNTLMHLQGYFKKHLTNEEKAQLTTAIKDYQQNNCPLSTPLQLLYHYAKIFADQYLLQQFYFLPYPLSLAWRTEY